MVRIVLACSFSLYNNPQLYTGWSSDGAISFQLPVSNQEFISTNLTLSGQFKVVNGDLTNLAPAAAVAFVSYSFLSHLLT